MFSAAAALRKPAVNITIHKLSDGVNISEPGASEQFLDRHNDPPGHGKPSVVANIIRLVHTDIQSMTIEIEKFCIKVPFCTASEARSSAC